MFFRHRPYEEAYWNATNLASATAKLEKDGATDVAVFTLSELVSGYPVLNKPQFNNSFWFPALEAWVAAP